MCLSSVDTQAPDCPLTLALPLGCGLFLCRLLWSTALWMCSLGRACLLPLSGGDNWFAVALRLCFPTAVPRAPNLRSSLVLLLWNDIQGTEHSDQFCGFCLLWCSGPCACWAGTLPLNCMYLARLLIFLSSTSSLTHRHVFSRYSVRVQSLFVCDTCWTSVKWSLVCSSAKTWLLLLGVVTYTSNLNTPEAGAGVWG